MIIDPHNPPELLNWGHSEYFIMTDEEAMAAQAIHKITCLLQRVSQRGTPSWINEMRSGPWQKLDVLPMGNRYPLVSDGVMHAQKHVACGVGCTICAQWHTQ
jgi:hypothetical protein